MHQLLLFALFAASGALAATLEAPTLTEHWGRGSYPRGVVGGSGNGIGGANSVNGIYSGNLSPGQGVIVYSHSGSTPRSEPEPVRRDATQDDSLMDKWFDEYIKPGGQGGQLSRQGNIGRSQNSCAVEGK